jgi:hypothetical protein
MADLIELSTVPPPYRAASLAASSSGTGSSCVRAQEKRKARVPSRPAAARAEWPPPARQCPPLELEVLPGTESLEKRARKRSSSRQPSRHSVKSDLTPSPRHWDKLPRGRQHGVVDSGDDSGSVDDPTKDRSGVDLDDPMLPGTTLQETPLYGAGPSEIGIAPPCPDTHVDVIDKGLPTTPDEKDEQMREMKTELGVLHFQMSAIVQKNDEERRSHLCSLHEKEEQLKKKDEIYVEHLKQIEDLGSLIEALQSSVKELQRPVIEAQVVEPGTNVVQASAPSSSDTGTSNVSGTVAPMEQSTVDGILVEELTDDRVIVDAMTVDGVILDMIQATVFQPNRLYLPTADGGIEESNILTDVSAGTPDSPVLVSGTEEFHAEYGDSPLPVREASRSATPTRSPRTPSLGTRLMQSMWPGKSRSPSVKR